MRKFGKKGEEKGARRIPVGPYPSSHIGRCVCVFEPSGLLLRVLPNIFAAARWRAKHFWSDINSTVRKCSSKAEVLAVFDGQMAKGLNSRREINDLLWYGGVASDWKGPKRIENQISRTIKV